MFLIATRRSLSSALRRARPGRPNALVRVGCALAILAALAAAPARAAAQQATTTTWVTRTGSSGFLQPATFTVAVTSTRTPTPSGGLVIFYGDNESTLLGLGILENGKASVTTPLLTAGPHTFNATYSGTATMANILLSPGAYDISAVYAGGTNDIASDPSETIPVVIPNSGNGAGNGGGDGSGGGVSPI